MASIRLRSFIGASSEIISSSTHIEQGLKPSSRPIVSGERGQPDVGERDRPAEERDRELFFAAASGPFGQASDSSASQVPAASACGPACRPSSAARISASVLASGEKPTISCPRTWIAGTRTVPVLVCCASSFSRSSAAGSFCTSRITIDSAGRSFFSCARNSSALAQCGQPSRTNASIRIASAAGPGGASAAWAGARRMAASRQRRSQPAMARGESGTWISCSSSRRRAVSTEARVRGPALSQMPRRGRLASDQTVRGKRQSTATSQGFPHEAEARMPICSRPDQRPPRNRRHAGARRADECVRGTKPAPFRRLRTIADAGDC